MSPAHAEEGAEPQMTEMSQIQTKGSGNGPEAIHVSESDEETTKVVHADGTIDYIDKNAIGGEVNVMPDGYFRSPQFIGTVAVWLCAVGK